MSEDMIEKYADLVERLDMLTKNHTELRDKLIPDEVKLALADLDAEYNPMIETVQTELATIKAQIEQTVLEQGSTLKGSRFMATWNKGRDGGWDSKKLEGYAMVHPEIMGAKKPDGQPTVSFRQVK
jgi:hypothetical protein